MRLVLSVAFLGVWLGAGVTKSIFRNIGISPHEKTESHIEGAAEFWETVKELMGWSCNEPRPVGTEEKPEHGRKSRTPLVTMNCLPTGFQFLRPQRRQIKDTNDVNSSGTRDTKFNWNSFGLRFGKKRQTPLKQYSEDLYFWP